LNGVLVLSNETRYMVTDGSEDWLEEPKIVSRVTMKVYTFFCLTLINILNLITFCLLIEMEKSHIYSRNNWQKNTNANLQRNY